MLVPSLAFDKSKFRLGYGKGFYDRYLNKYLKEEMISSKLLAGGFSGISSLTITYPTDLLRRRFQMEFSMLK